NRDCLFYLLQCAILVTFYQIQKIQKYSYNILGFHPSSLTLWWTASPIQQSYINGKGYLKLFLGKFVDSVPDRKVSQN
ncbi:hypothetical protein QUF58_05195, partial [Anaerolineales bacterium HSG24]|nr:hypothetical protein [Anaerolineales bacterium HSG24]